MQIIFLRRFSKAHSVCPRWSDTTPWLFSAVILVVFSQKQEQQPQICRWTTPVSNQCLQFVLPHSVTSFSSNSFPKVLGKKRNNPVVFGAGCVIGVSMGTNSTHSLGWGWDILFRKRCRKNTSQKLYFTACQEGDPGNREIPDGDFFRVLGGDSAEFNCGGKNPEKPHKQRYFVKLWKKRCFPWQHQHSKK